MKCRKKRYRRRCKSCHQQGRASIQQQNKTRGDKEWASVLFLFICLELEFFSFLTKKMRYKKIRRSWWDAVPVAVVRLNIYSVCCWISLFCKHILREGGIGIIQCHHSFWFISFPFVAWGERALREKAQVRCCKVDWWNDMSLTGSEFL